ncbi:MAG: phosphocarrier protein HPr [Bacillota bacterium]
MEKTITITDEAGMHARPASKLAQEAAKYDEDIKLTYNGKTVDLKSIMGVMSLGVPQHAEVTIAVTGDDEENTLNALIKAMDELDLTQLN